MVVDRMRFAHQAIEQLPQEHTNTHIIVHYFMKYGAIPKVKIGNNRPLVNYDIFSEYLATPQYNEKRVRRYPPSSVKGRR
ncbi:MAG: hypothetical protein RSC99_09600 [Clostridiales bacterium]